MVQNIRETRALSNHLERPHFRRTQPLRLFSVIDVERGHIPAIDLSVRIQQCPYIEVNATRRDLPFR